MATPLLTYGQGIFPYNNGLTQGRNQYQGENGNTLYRPANFLVDRLSTAYAFGRDGFLKRYGENELKIDFLLNSEGVALFEQSATEISGLTNSFDTWPLAARGTTTDSGEQGPFPNENWFLFTQNAGETTHPYRGFGVNVTSGNDIIYEVYAKRYTRNYLGISTSARTGALEFMYFDILNGTDNLIPAGFEGYTVPLPNGGYKCFVKFTAGVTGSYGAFAYASAGKTSVAPDDQGAILVGPMNFKEVPNKAAIVNAYGDSFIYNNTGAGTIVTRAQDSNDNTTINLSDYFGQIAGVIHFRGYISDSAVDIFFTDRSTTNSVKLGRSGSFRIRISHSSNQTNLVGSTTPTGVEYFSLVAKYESGNNKLWLNGQEIKSNADTIVFDAALGQRVNLAGASTYFVGSGQPTFYEKLDIYGENDLPTNAECLTLSEL